MIDMTSTSPPVARDHAALFQALDERAHFEFDDVHLDADIDL